MHEFSFNQLQGMEKEQMFMLGAKRLSTTLDKESSYTHSNNIEERKADSEFFN